MSSLAWPRACTILAKLFVKQALRSRVIWFLAIIVSLPGVVAVALLEQEPSDAWPAAVGVAISLLAIVPPVIAGGVVADELDSQTYTFLWARPIPRWTVLIGKLMGAAPVVMLVVVASAAIGWSAVSHEGLVTQDQLLRACIAMGTGGLAASAVAAGIGTLVVRHPIVAGIVYMLLLDVPVGAIPFSLRYLSLSFQLSELTGVGEAGVAPWVSVLWIAGIAGLWLTIGLWRVGRLEASAKS